MAKKPSSLSQTQTQGLLEHLEDLRGALLRSLLFVALGALLSLTQTEAILSFLKQPLAPFLKDTSGELF